MERNLKGVWIPIEIWDMKDDKIEVGAVKDSEGNERKIFKPTCLDKFIFIEVNNLDNGGGTKAGDDYFAELVGCTEKQVESSLDYWVDRGFIYRQYDKSGNRTLKSYMNKYAYDTIKKMCNGKVISKPHAAAKHMQEEKKLTYEDVITSLMCGDELKEILRKYIRTVAGRFKVEQFIDMLTDLEEKCGGDEKIMTEVVNKSYLHNWSGFYPDKFVKKEESTPERGSIKVINHHTVKVTKLLKLSKEELDQLVRNPRCTPKNGKWGKRSYDPNNEEDYKIIEKAVRLTCGEVECHLKELISEGYTPNCEGTAPVLKWLDTHQDWPKYFERDDFCWWMKD